MFRWGGTNLASNIGAANISVESPFSASMLAQDTSSWFLFTGGFEGRYRFNDMTIEGDRLVFLSHPRHTTSHCKIGKQAP